MVFFLCCFEIAASLLLMPHFPTEKSLLEVCRACWMVREQPPGLSLGGNSNTHTVPSAVQSILGQSFITRFIYSACFRSTAALLTPTGEPRQWRRLWLYQLALLSVSSSRTLWPLQILVTACAEGNRTQSASWGRSPLINRSRVSSVCCRAIQPSWLKGWADLRTASLMGVISGSGSKHSGYKIRRECIKAMSWACFTVTITKYPKERAKSKRSMKSSKLLC